MCKDEFINDCISKSPELVVQKNLIDGTSYFFDFIKKGEEFEFKKDLANSLEVHIRDIVIVGSGKLGFSIKPDSSNLNYYPFKKFDHDYEENIENDKSDLDVAIVSGNLFDRQMVNIYEHTNSYSSGAFKGGSKRSFADYILKGWIRPDFIPDDYLISSAIYDAHKKYKDRYGRDINIGIYKSWFYFEKYHRNNINTIKLNQIAI
jgi:hypothetical protein